MANKKYLIDNAELMAEWNWDKNTDLDPKKLTLGSHIKAWWKCDKGHEWQAVIKDRNHGNGCPYCANKKLLRGYNDLQTVNPNLAREWNYEKNNELTPKDVMPYSNSKVWWKCYKGHEWQSTINHRSNGRGCPVCNSERNTSFPEYAIMYYLEKHNIEAVHSYKKNGYELDIYIPTKKVAVEYDGYFWHKNKTKYDLDKNSRCKKDGITLYRIREGLPSLNDSSLDYTVQKTHKDLSIIIEKVLSEIITKIICFDIDIERDRIAIENLREFSEKENSILFSNPQIAKEWNYEMNGNLKPQHFTENSSKKVWWKCSKGHEWQSTISHRNNGRGCPYCAGKKVLISYNDLQTVNPALAKEWHYEKNINLKPEDFTANSGKKVWWKCTKGHEWQAKINSRNNGNGCPYCSGRNVIIGENDLQTVNPALAGEWNYKKNNGLTPKDVMPNSIKKVWWKCNNGHEWQAVIQYRNNGSGCPYCARQKVIKGHNDLQTVNPALAKEWHYEKNINLKSEDFTANSGKKVWWKCTKGHEWQATIDNRSKDRGCPYCAGRKVLKGYNDLQTVNPTLANEWNYEKNNGLDPADVTVGSNKKVWWKCNNGHEWQSTINNRSNGNGCPMCRKNTRNHKK